MRKAETRQIKIQLSPEQRKTIHLAAAIRDVPMAEFCRAAAMASAAVALEGFKLPSPLVATSRAKKGSASVSTRPRERSR